MFDGHIYLPGSNTDDALGAFRYFNSGDPLETPYAYFVSAMPSSLPSEVADSNILSDGLKCSDYRLIGDIKQLIPFGPVTGDEDSVVDPRVISYVFASGAVERVQATEDSLTFKMSIEQYVGPLQGKASIGVNCIIDFARTGAARWAFLKDAKKRKNFIKQGGYVAVEGHLMGLDIIKGGVDRGVVLEVRVEDVTLLGRAPVPSTEVLEIEDDTPLRGRGKKSALPATPLKFSYSSIPSSQSLGKRRRVDSESSPAAPSSSQPEETSS
ncbi:hypothetical protein DFP72DRAFT_816999 [Ephemerocybe angulata]|uniref:Uncharacterized protein n=1 Tax=Ephemerocybe angulata TaxID=980116 RepID=A0A8H6HRT5_9AGAR|nr:hypothetical protein DFP72DRAFT_816999 [Tulosesus angulatus]